jgi:hypothetical protein
MEGETMNREDSHEVEMVDELRELNHDMREMVGQVRGLLHQLERSDNRTLSEEAHRAQRTWMAALECALSSSHEWMSRDTNMADSVLDLRCACESEED